MSSSFDSIYKKMASSLESGGAGQAHVAKIDPTRHISPVVAHELNNLFTIIQGYADRLALKHNKIPRSRHISSLFRRRPGARRPSSAAPCRHGRICPRTRSRIPRRSRPPCNPVGSSPDRGKFGTPGTVPARRWLPIQTCRGNARRSAIFRQRLVLTLCVGSRSVADAILHKLS